MAKNQVLDKLTPENLQEVFKNKELADEHEKRRQEKLKEIEEEERKE